MNPESERRVEKFFFIFLCLCIAAFLLAAILPGRPLVFAPRKFLYLSLTLVLLKGFWDWRKHRNQKYLEILPFLILFLLASNRLSRLPAYDFGVDDAYYYSYVSSIFLDHDLDLSNQYKLAKLEEHLDQKALEAKTPAGYSPNIFPVGLSFYWTPFFLIGHLLATLLGLSTDGFSRPYTHMVLLGNLFLVCAGLYFTFRFCSNFFSRRISIAVTAALVLTTPYLYYYFFAFTLISEPLAFALIAAFLFLVAVSAKKTSGRLWLFLGIFFGTLTMVRLHNVVVAIIPIAILFFSTDKKTFLRLSGLFIAGSILGFLPQLIVWKILNGEWFFSMGGSFLPWWKRPFVLETLFSARKGLFPWSPVVVLCLIGLLLFSRKWKSQSGTGIWGWALLCVFLGTIYINSAQADWWGAATVGSRRFVPFVSIFALGLASLFFSLRKTGRILASFVIAGLIFLNLHIVSLTLSQSLNAEHADRFSDFLPGPYSVFRFVVYPMQFPVQLSYHLRYGIPFYGSLNEFFIGEDVFYFEKKAGDEILNQDSPLFGDGWIVHNGERKTWGSASVLYVPMFMKEKPRFVIELSLKPVEKHKDVWIDFYWNDKFSRSRKIPGDGKMFEVPVRSRDYHSDVNSLRMHIYHSRSERLAPSLILQKIHFRPPMSFAELFDLEP